MTDGGGTLSRNEVEALIQRVVDNSKDLSDKERTFLLAALRAGAARTEESEVQGFSMFTSQLVAQETPEAVSEEEPPNLTDPELQEMIEKLRRAKPARTAQERDFLVSTLRSGVTQEDRGDVEGYGGYTAIYTPISSTNFVYVSPPPPPPPPSCNYCSCC
jgi:hypothetical protein